MGNLDFQGSTKNSEKETCKEKSQDKAKEEKIDLLITRTKTTVRAKPMIRLPYLLWAFARWMQQK